MVTRLDSQERGGAADDSVQKDRKHPWPAILAAVEARLLGKCPENLADILSTTDRETEAAVRRGRLKAESAVS